MNAMLRAIFVFVALLLNSPVWAVDAAPAATPEQNPASEEKPLNLNTKAIPTLIALLKKGMYSPSIVPELVRHNTAEARQGLIEALAVQQHHLDVSEIAFGLGALAIAEARKPLLKALSAYPAKISILKIPDSSSADRAKYAIIWALARLDGQKLRRSDFTDVCSWWAENHERVEKE